jgi:ligand-binding sensor domain-containing protein
MLGVALLIAGCGADDKQDITPVADKIANDIAEMQANSSADASFVSAAEDVLPVVDEAMPDGINGVNDMLIYDSAVYAATDNGLIIYDFVLESTDFLQKENQFKTLAFHDGELYAGGDAMFTVTDNVLTPVATEISGCVQALLSDSQRLLVGTDAGLYVRSISGEEELIGDVSVTALAFDNDGLWIGTNGQGLYRWDGDEFKKRFLLRDTTIFDYVNDIEFNRGHLYVAAESGFFVFDGGRWEHWTVSDGLPSNNIRSVDASGWMIHLATDKGVISYFAHNLFPADNLEEIPAGVVKTIGNRIIVGTENNGIMIQAGSFVRTIVDPVIEKDTGELVQSNIE